MRRTVLAIPIAALSLVAWLTPPAIAQDTKSARGTITAMGASSITLKSADSNMTFAVDSTTDVVVRGGSTASRAAASAGKPGPKLAELLKVGDSVEVRYREKGGTMQATMIRAIDATAAVRAPASEDKAASSNGTVEALSGTSLTISGSTGGGGTFKQTFTVDASTKVIAVGAGTAAAASGGKIPITEVVARGDRVRVSYQPKGDSLHATEIRVTEKALKK